MDLKNKIMKLYSRYYDSVKTRKIVNLLKLILVDDIKDISIILNLTPISLVSLNKYINDKEELLKYLTEQELEIFLSKINIILESKIEKLIRVIMVDNETNINSVIKLVPITVDTIKKYASDKKELSKYLTDQELQIFLERIDKLLISEQKNREAQQLNLMRSIIDDILHTRKKYTDILNQNFMSRPEFEELLSNEEYMNTYFPKGTVHNVKSKIEENKLVRESTPRNCFVIEERASIECARKDIYFLNQFDNKRLNFAACYLSSGANLEYVIKTYETNISVVLSILSDSKLKQILEPHYYENLERYINIEKCLVGNDINFKKKFIAEIVQFLQENNFDKESVISYFKLPEYLFNKILMTIINSSYCADSESIKEIQKLLNIDNEKNIKH